MHCQAGESSGTRKLPIAGTLQLFSQARTLIVESITGAHKGLDMGSGINHFSAGGGGRGSVL